MDVLKKLVGRRNMVGSEESCYRQKQTRGLSYRPPALVTSNTFDTDETFATVAKALLFRYEHEGMSERDAINVTLVTSEEKRAFLESLDLRHATMFTNHEEDLEEALVNDLVQRTRYIFSGTLKLLWRESVVPDDGEPDTLSEEELVVGIDGHEYRRPLKTPKNLHSPITSSKSASQSSLSLTLKSSGRQRRRRFFPDSSEQTRCRTRIRLDFKLSGAQPVQSLQLDGLEPPLGSYAPPSPIDSSCPRARTVTN
jgi:hypothetical protein